MNNEFRVEESAMGYRVALYRNGQYYVTFVDGLTLAAANREALSLTRFWERIQARPRGAEAVNFKAAS